MDHYTEQIGDYVLAVNEGSTDVSIIRPVLCGNEYHKHIHPLEDDIWIDGGAHVGAFAVRYGPFAKHIYCYEPCPQNFSMLQYNVNAYGCGNITLIDSALVSDDDTVAVLSMSTGKDRTSGSILRYHRRTERYTVNAVNIVSEIQRTKANKLKLDVEGAEFDLLMAIPVDVLKSLDEIVFEYHFSMIGDLGTGLYYFQLIDYLKSVFDEVVYLGDVKRYWNTVVYARKK